MVLAHGICFTIHGEEGNITCGLCCIFTGNISKLFVKIFAWLYFCIIVIIICFITCYFFLFCVCINICKAPCYVMFFTYILFYFFGISTVSNALLFFLYPRVLNITFHITYACKSFANTS